VSINSFSSIYCPVNFTLYPVIESGQVLINVTFANLWGTDIVDYLTTTGRDLGIDLSSIFTIDIRAVIRPQNSVWNMGALEEE